MRMLPYAIFYLSGVSALVFETLWFRQAGLAFGNSVWAGSMILASFMAGLSVGNWCAGSIGHRTTKPFLIYAILELVIGAIGFGLVLGFAHADEWLLPLLRPTLDNPLLLNGMRLAFAFVCLLLPTAAMGATLPLMVQGLSSQEVRFGQRLGSLYAINTLGAMTGTLIAEFVLIERFGIRGTGFIALGCNLVAGAAAFLLSSRVAPLSRDRYATSPRQPFGSRGRRILLAAFLAGGSLLALEVVWMRFMTLFFFGTTQIFATMLAIVLCGIGLGGWLASLLARSSEVSRWLPLIAFVSGIFVVGGYFGFAGGLVSRETGNWSPLFLAVPLVFPVSVLSGSLFTLMGQVLHDGNKSDTQSAGYLSLFNTMGAMCGAWLSGFVLLPQLGMEGAFLALAGSYLAIGCLCLDSLVRLTPRQKRVMTLAGGTLLVALALFPDGMDRALFRKVAGQVTSKAEQIVAIKESVTGTLIYTETRLHGEPVSHRLITDGHSMASTNSHSWRYMKQYVYLPVALHPAPRKACLISFGCGVTARALTDTKELTQIDVVDISKDILEMNRVINPAPEDQPLRDPRVRVFIEDGRFHLLSTAERYDLITSEPPPPKAASAVNLYTREYFQLIHDRLADGGMTTYWLPHHSLSQSDSRAIIRAWCDVFSECSLWNGSGEDWMLFGIRGNYKPVSDERFRQQWSDPLVAPILAACGFESPGLLGATFIGDRSLMLDLTKDSEPLIDNFPYRLSPNARRYAIESRYKELLNPAACRARYVASEHIRRLWPAGAVQAALEYFPISVRLHEIFASKPFRISDPVDSRLQATHAFLTLSPLKTPVLWCLGSSFRDQCAIDRVRERLPDDVQVLLHLGHRALADRDFDTASNLYSKRRRLVRDHGGND